MIEPCTNDLNCGMQSAWLLAATVTLSVTGLDPLCDLSVLVTLQAASSHTQTEDLSTYR